MDVDSLNQFLKSANEAISCTGDCQKEKKAEKLKQKWLDAETQAASSDARIDQAYRKYVTFTEGRGAYIQSQQAFLEERADTEIESIRAKITAMYQDQLTQKKQLSKSKETTHTLNEYHQTLKRENEQLSKTTDNYENDTLTNDRKIYYEKDRVSWAKRIGFYLWVLYLIGVVVFIARHLQELRFRMRTEWIRLVGLLVLPFLLPFMVLRIRSYWIERKTTVPG
jgi:hypothetical protein